MMRAAITAASRRRAETTPPEFMIGFSTAQIQALPNSGTAWNNVNTQANATLTPEMPTSGSASSQRASQAVGCALRYIRNGVQADVDKVEAALDALVAIDPATRGYQAYYRQMAGWVIAADLIGYDTPTWRTFLTNLITFEDYNDPASSSKWVSLYKNGWDNPTNHGTLGRASLQAIALYLGDSALFAESVKWMRCYWGDRSEHGTVYSTTASPGNMSLDSSGFPNSTTWAHDAANWTPVTVAAADDTKDGASITDVCRDATAYSLNGSGQPVWGTSGPQYFSVAIGGAYLSNVLMAANGYPDCWTWSDNAALRNLRYGYRWPNNWEGRPTTIHGFSLWYWVDALANKVYDTTEFPMSPAGGYSFSYTDWLPF
jgi:hypothetical protein